MNYSDQYSTVALVQKKFRIKQNWQHHNQCDYFTAGLKDPQR